MIAARVRGWPFAVICLWLVAAVVLIVAMRGAIPGGWLKDTDDYMRLMEVRDWLAGQSWYDVSQHRLNPPAGAQMHWTRLVDLPLAGGFLLLTPLLGSAWAEIVTMVMVPLLLLLATMLTVGWIISRLVELPRAAELGPVLVLLNLFTVAQFMPLRIDHHAWQLTMAAVAAAGLIARKPRPGGTIAGAALGFWLTVSLEGLPFAAACLAAAGIWWAFDRTQADRLTALAATLALSAAGFFLVTTAPSAWTLTYCDSTSAAQLCGLAVAAAGVAVWTRSRFAATPLRRLIGLAAVAGAAAAGLALAAPQCLGNPFARLDPLVYETWYLRVQEGLPVWRLPARLAIQELFMPAIGLIGSLWQLSRLEDGALRWRWITATLLLIASTGVGMLVMRASGVAAIMAIPGAMVVVSALLTKVRSINLVPLRATGTAAALLLPTPLTPAVAMSFFHSPPESPRKRVSPDDAAAFEAIARLPRSLIFAPLDVTPSLIARTGQSAIAGPYHRNDRAIADVIRVYTGPDETARRIVARYGARYLVTMGSGELGAYRRIAPDGLAARLAADRPPAWLRPVPMPAGQLKVWRVIP